MDDLLNIVKQIFGDYNGTVIIAILAIVKYVYPWYKKTQEDAAHREDMIIRLLKRNNILTKASMECMKKAGIEVNIPEIPEGEI